MADLTTAWMGLRLKSPLVVGASPLALDPGAAAEAVAAGAGAIVMPSLFEEQLNEEQMRAHRFLDSHADMNAEARHFMPDTAVFGADAEHHLAQMRALKRSVEVPLIASLNGTTPGGWTRYARQLADAGADALELNLYEVVTQPSETGQAVEARQLAVVEAVVASVSIPVAVKLSPFYASLPAFVSRLEQVGAKGVTLFNRFYEPAIDLDDLSVHRTLVASSPTELPLRLHGLAVLSAVTPLSLACSGGVHSGKDMARAVLCGAHVVQLASILLQRGPGHVAPLLAEFEAWLDAKGYASSAAARAVLSIDRVPEPAVWTRLNYIRTLQTRPHPTTWSQPA
jgi:dihydroorotate dehydrogenase (fumarate)